jgi:hypothetical protein
MEQLYRAMMNHGFIIFELNTKFVLEKIPTPISRTPISGGKNWQFNSFDEAVDAVKRLIDWKEPVTADVQIGSTTWRMELMYRHKGLGIKFAELGELGSTSYETALAEANKRANSYIVNSGLEKDVIGFEVKVRPCTKR